MKGKQKVYSILDTVLAVLALVFGIGFILSGIGLGVAKSVIAPLTSGALGVLVGIVFFVFGLRFFNVIR
jgi:bacteriorhodopsin